MLGKATKLTVRTIFQIYNAGNSILAIDYLDGNVSYKIGRLFKQAEAIVKEATRARELNNKNYLKDLKTAKEEEKVGLLELLNDKNRAIEDNEEDIGIPEIKLSELICEKDFKTVVKITGQDNKEYSEVKEFRKGQTLVPQMFFNLMGELIIDNQNN